MTGDAPYDSSLTGKVRQQLETLGTPTPQEESELERLIGRLEVEFRHLFEDPVRQERTLDFLRGTARSPSYQVAPSQGALRDTYGELIALSSQLDTTGDPSEGFLVGERVGQRAHELAHTVEGFLPALHPGEFITEGFHRLIALLSKVIQNAVAKIQAFAKLLGVSSFSVAFATAPPVLTVTLTFGNG
jgi:hypothetical protein